MISACMYCTVQEQRDIPGAMPAIVGRVPCWADFGIPVKQALEGECTHNHLLEKLFRCYHISTDQLVNKDK